jgi:mRNA-degrading endonuclease RelE of RelBE toxin-antitoxin system
VSEPAWRRELVPRAQRDLRRLDAKSIRRILDAIDRVVDDPDNATGVVKLAGRPEFRLRVGDRRVLDTPVSEIRDNAPYGIKCTVDMPIGGIGAKADRVANVRTVWAFDRRGAAPRLVNAYPKP